MTLWWIGDVVLLLVVIPIVAILLGRVLGEARAIVPSVHEIATPRVAARRTSTPSRCS
jgi:ABC-type methionine transport system permease subunit